MKIDPTSSTEQINDEAQNHKNNEISLQRETTHNFSTNYIHNINRKTTQTHREFGADRLNNLGKEERNLAQLTETYRKKDSTVPRLDGKRCVIIQ